MTANEDLVGKFIKQAKTETKYTPPVVSRRERVLTGVLISVIIALIYSTIAELINIIPNPELPLYFHPFGTIGNILYALIVAGLAGSLGAWSEKSTTGVVAGSLTLLFGIELNQLLSSFLLFSAFIPTAFGLFALLFLAFEAVLLGLVMGLIRLTVDMQLEKPQLRWWNWQKSWPILALLAIAIIAGYLHKVPIEWVYSLRRADKLIQAGLEAKTSSELPKQLSEKHMGKFLEYSSVDYKLEVNNSIQHLFFQADPNLSISLRDNIVIVYFESGQDIACLVNGGAALKCLPIIRKIKLPPIIL